MTAQTVTDAASKAVAKRDTGGAALINQYQSSFRSVLPSHIKPETWLRLAQSALKQGKKVQGPDGVQRTELEVAAMRNVGVFCGQLLVAARLGLEPGTEEFYLTVRSGQIQGIVGYQGYIELMYRAGAVDSVIAEVVRQNDVFEWRAGAIDSHVPPRWEGKQTQPYHEINWDLDDRERGPLRLVYSYALMKGGATSKVVVLNRSAIERIRAKSASAKSSSSPWNTDEEAMWLKSGVRQLRKWVPTSAEYIREQLRAERDVAAEGPQTTPGPIVADVTGFPEAPMYDDDDQVADDVVDAEVVA